MPATHWEKLCKNWLPYSLTWTALYKKNNRFFDSTQYWQNKQTNNQAMRTILSAELFSIICCLCNQIQQQCKVLIRLSRQLHDETPSNTHTHRVNNVHVHLRLSTWGIQEKAAYADPSSPTQEQCHNTFSNLRHTRMRKWGLAGRLWHCKITPPGKVEFGTEGKPANQHTVYTNAYQTHSVLM